MADGLLAYLGRDLREALAAGAARQPAVSPDGKYFFFASDRTNEEEILPEGRLTRDALLRLHKNIRKGSDDQISFYHKDVSTLLLHPYMHKLEGHSGSGLMEVISESNLIQVDRRLFTGAF